ncbi:MAG: hypothetical protein KF715_05010 [Candidatus Didemnitutus sp.]|nr:hypothetical protein [Candidatus Didemnitutus sp.]
MASFEVRGKLGLDTNDWASSLGRASVRLDNFSERAVESSRTIKRGFDGLKNIFLAGGLLTAAKEFFQSAIDYSQKYEGAVSQDIAATRRFGDALDAIKITGAKAGVAVVGWVEQAAIGLASLVYGTEAAVDAYDTMQKEAAKAADEEKARKIAAAQDALGKGRQDIALAEAPGPWERLVILINAAVDLRERQRGLEQGSADALALQLDIEKNLAAQRKITADLTADEGKELADASRVRLALSEEERRAAMDRMIAAEKAAALTNQRAEVEEELLNIAEALRQKELPASQLLQRKLELKKEERAIDGELLRLAEERAAAEASVANAAARLQEGQRDRVSFTLSEAVTGTRGNATDQARAREIQRIEEDARRSFDAGFEKSALEKQNRADALRQGFGRLDSRERDPAKAFKDALKESEDRLKELCTSLRAEVIK